VTHLLVLAALQGALLAPSIEGTWQGMLTAPNQNQIRLALKIAKNGNAYEGRFYNLENGRQFNLGAITLQGNAVKIVIPGNGMTYEGKIEADGNSITGALTPHRRSRAILLCPHRKGHRRPSDTPSRVLWPPSPISSVR